MTTIGIDVSKLKLDCLWLKDPAADKVKTKVFSNTPKDHQAFIAWAEQHTKQPIESIHFIMEATGIYHEALAYALYQAGAQVSVVNPAKVHNYAKSFGTRTKTDKRDSKILAHYGATQSPRLWQPEPEVVRQLKALMARLDAVDRDIQREKNRLEKAEIARVSNEIVRSIHTVLKHLTDEKKRLEDLINNHIDQHPDLKQDRQLLESIPGVGPIISRMMMVVIRSRSFDSAGQCAAYLGLIPVLHESGTSVRERPRLSKAGDSKVRAKLYMAAVVSIQHNPDIKQQYERLLKNGKTKMSALGAAMRKLVQICFGVLKHQTPYHARAKC
jgi:transposase